MMGRKNSKTNLWNRIAAILLTAGLITALFGGCFGGGNSTLPPIQTEETGSTAPMVSDLLDTTDKVIAFVEEAVQAGATEFSMVCSEAIHNKLMKVVYTADGTEVYAFQSLLDQSGAYSYRFVNAGMKRTITITNMSLYPGCEILRSIAAGTEEKLSSTLKKALAEARSIADACRTEDPLETAKNIQSVLCSRVRYAYMTNRSNADTAIGALLNGTADCDGYADAFYLVGNLAGLEVRYHQGTSSSYDSVNNKLDTGSHMWNLLKLDGTWRVVDVCWADGEDGIDYTWFNIGRDRASRSRTWQEDLSVPLLETTDLSTRPETEYSVTNRESLKAAIQKALEKEQASFTIIFDSDNYSSQMDAFNILGNSYAGEIFYYWDACTRVLTIILDDPEQ